MELTEARSRHDAAKRPGAVGTVALVGAGPGDRDLLTLKAARLIAEAHVIVYDRLVSEAVLALANPQAVLVYVGKAAGNHSVSQSTIHEILIEHARRGQFVVRLKGGDPMIFARADEELAALRAAGIPTHVVPGITSASAAAASLGISLTARGRNAAFSFLTARDAAGYAEHDWRSLARAGATAAVYMGVGAARFVQGRLLLHGADADTPVTIVENASRDNERCLATSLSELPTAIELADVRGPAILFIGIESADADPIALPPPTVPLQPAGAWL